MKRASLSSHNSGACPSPDHWDGISEAQEGWGSERVPLMTRGSGAAASGATVPFSSGRAVPSKWEDAERWITRSPVSGNAANRVSLGHPQRKPKSKSGPLGNPGPACLSNCSPAAPLVERENPFSDGFAVFADSASVQCGANDGEGLRPMHPEPCIARSVSLPGCSDAVGKTSSPSTQRKDKPRSTEDAETTPTEVQRRDMATQISPRHSCSSDKAPVIPTPAPLPTSTRLEVRDVEVDGRATIIRWSKKHGSSVALQQSAPTGENHSPWAVAEERRDHTSKQQREEAKIAAWENLQKAKAETAIRELEVSLEKKRSSSMDRISRKLRMAQIKAQEMRRSISEAEQNQAPRTSSHRAASFFKTVQRGVARSCFTSNAL